MMSVCTDTVRDAEVGIKSDVDVMKVANGISSICQEKAKSHLGASAASQSLTREWCHQLDGRLTMAMETGFFFALAPEEAERQAKENNPYVSTTRRKCCGRFVDSLRQQAQAGGLFINATPGASKMPAPQQGIASSKPMPRPSAGLPAQTQEVSANPQPITAHAPPMPLPSLPLAPPVEPAKVATAPASS